MRKYGLLLAAATMSATMACSGSPTAPTPTTAVIPTVAVVTPPVVVTPPNPLLADPRFSLAFYRMFALGGGQILVRQTKAPSIYLFTVDQAGAPIDARTLDSTAAALINVAGALTGTFGLEGMTRGTGPAGAGMIAVQWASEANPAKCGEAGIGNPSMLLYYKTSTCGCPGIALRPLTVKHELGHVLGFHHTDSPDDLMYGGVSLACDQNPSERERFHASVAYSQAVGSGDPK